LRRNHSFLDLVERFDRWTDLARLVPDPVAALRNEHELAAAVLDSPPAWASPEELAVSRRHFTARIRRYAHALVRAMQTYLQKMNSRARPGCQGFLRAVALPRWCGVIRWFIKDAPLADFVYDTTDVLRDKHRLGSELLRGLICWSPQFSGPISKTAEYFNVPFA
jgi:hypothetical protein